MKRIFRFIGLIAAMAVIVTALPISVNALKLQDYDYKFSGGNFSRDTETGVDPEAAAYFDSTIKYSGDYSLKMTHGSNNVEYRVSIEMERMKPDTDYKISFMLKGENVNSLMLTVTNQSNWWRLDNLFGKNFEWTPVELEFNYPSTQHYAYAVFIISAEVEGIWIDDLKIYQKGENGQFTEIENSIANGGFDNPGTVPVISATDSAEEEATEKFTKLTNDDALIVKKAENIVIDGNTSDWENYTSYPISTYVPCVEGEQTIDARIKYSYDDDALYYLVEVQDETHNYVEGSGYWSGDSIQSAIDNNNSNGYGVPVGMYYDEKADKLVFISDTAGTEFDSESENSIKGAAKRNGETTVYEVKIPWIQVGTERPDKVKFNLIINDNDTGARKGWVQISDGIGQSKNSSFFPYMFIGDNGGSISSAMMKNSQINMGEKAECDISYSNVRNRAVDVDIKYGDEVKKIHVDPMTKYTNTIEFSDFNEVGMHKEKVVIDDGENINEISVTGTVIPDDAFVKDFSNSINSWVSELSEMRDECIERGLPTPYEKADIRLLKRYVETTIPYELKRGEYARIAHFYDVLPQIYEECRNSLTAILNGEKEAVDVPKYVTSDLEIRDGAYWGTVEKDGIQYESPITFNGICSFAAPNYYSEDLKEYGLNHTETGFYGFQVTRWNGTEFETIPEEERFGKRNDEYEWSNVLKQLDDAEKNGMSVSLMMNVMGFPHMEQYGFSDYADPTNHVYNPFNVNHPMFEVVAEAVYKEVGELCKRYKCIKNIALLNEPTVKLAGNPYYDDQWADFLKERYDGDINRLNEVYGNDADYKDFSEIKMPSAVLYGNPWYHDYRLFCEDVYNQFLTVLSRVAKKYTGLPVCVKEMQRSREYNSDYTLNFATTLEKNKDLLDLAGCDAFYVPSSSGLGLDTKMMWYDYITSVMEAPVQNGEDHIGSDGQGGVEDKYYDDVSYKASTWQGTIHGGGMQAIWMYSDFDRNLQQGNGNEYEPQVNLLQLPKSLRDCYVNNMDGMRLANEVNALYTAPRNVGILWANTSWGYNAKFMNGLFKAYENAIYNGQRVKFVTEYTLEQLDKIKLLVIPGTTHILPDTLAAIKNYVDNGGKIVVIGKDSLSFDDFNQPNDRETVDYILSKATIIDCNALAAGGTLELPENYDEIMTKEYENAGLMNVVLKDAETGEKVEGVEWISNELNGKTVINPFNYDRNNTKTVEIWVNGEKVNKFTDLKGRKTYNGTITLGCQEPYLIEVDGESGFTDIAHVGWASEAIYGLCDSGVINGVGDRRFEPDDSVTREQLAKMIVGASKTEIKSGDMPFGDVDNSEWYADFVKTAYDNDITKGISDTEFGVGKSVTREDLAVMAYRAAQKVGKLSDATDDDNGFKDGESISDYAKEAVATLKSSGIINGDENGNFNPSNSCTRAEAAKIIYNIFFK